MKIKKAEKLKLKEEQDLDDMPELDGDSGDEGGGGAMPPPPPA